MYERSSYIIEESYIHMKDINCLSKEYKTFWVYRRKLEIYEVGNNTSQNIKYSTTCS